MEWRTRSIEDVRKRIEEWRSSKRKSKQRRMPEELWEMAVELAQKHGVSRISVDLGLGYTGLKTRYSNKAREIERGTEANGGGFVELFNLAGCGQIRVEVNRQDGCLMRLELGSGLGLDAAPIISAFLGRC